MTMIEHIMHMFVVDCPDTPLQCGGLQISVSCRVCHVKHERACRPCSSAWSPAVKRVGSTGSCSPIQRRWQNSDCGTACADTTTLCQFSGVKQSLLGLGDTHKYQPCVRLIGPAEEGANSRELGPSILDSFNWVLPATLAAVVLCMGLMLGYDTQLGLLLRPSPHQLYRALQLAVPLATLAWAVTAAVASWKAVAVSWSACKADAAAPKAAAGLEPEPEPQAAAATVQHPPAARSPEPHANGSGLANGYYSPGAERPGRYLHFLGLTPPRAADVAAALLRAAEEAPADGMDEPVEPVANGDAAAHAAANDGAAAGPSKAAPTRGRATRGRGGRAGGRAAAKAASAEQQAALTATAGAKHQGAGEAFAGLVADPKAAPGGPPAAAAAANGNAAVAALGGDAAEAAEAVPQAAAVASRRRARKSVLGVWAPAVCAVAAAAALLVVFVAGAPQLLMAVNYSQAAIRCDC